MRSPLYIDRDFKRAYVFGWRLHHGLCGVVLAAVGIVLIAHDFKDRKIWLDFNN